MARIAGTSAENTLKAIRKAGVKLMYEHGFEAMSLRQLAAEVGIQPGSLYNHFKTKQDLLDLLLTEHMQALLNAADAHLAAVAAADAPTRLAAFVAFHVRYYAQKKPDVYVANSELRSIEKRRYAKVVAMREAYEAKLIAILADGMQAGRFAKLDEKVTAYGIIAMLTGVCTWYRKGGRLSLDELVSTYQRMVMHGVAASP